MLKVTFSLNIFWHIVILTNSNLFFSSQLFPVSQPNLPSLASPFLLCHHPAFPPHYLYYISCVSCRLGLYPGCLVPGSSVRLQQHGRSLGGEQNYGLEPSPQDGRAGGSAFLSFRWARTLRAPKLTTPSCETMSLKVQQSACHHSGVM